MPSARILPVLFACALAASAGAQVTIAAGSAAFLDISATGTAIIGVGDDTSHAITTTVGNDLFPAGNVVVTSNGYLVAGATAPAGSVFTNSAIAPTSTGTQVAYGATNKVICAYWDDLYGVGAPNATIFWQEIAGVLYVQYQNIGHFATSSAAGGPGITFQIQVSSATCGPHEIHLVYPDTIFGGVQAANDSGASATVGYIGGTASTNAQSSFNTVGSVPSGASLTISVPGFSQSWSSPTGAGSLLIVVCGGSPGGHFQLLATVNAGLFPNGWLYGLDITYPELLGELGAAPFFGQLTANGAGAIGPFFGLPPLTIYSIAFNIPPGSVPTEHTPAIGYTIP
jgi:hypothetical protein